ncbi:6203_t:CDS:1, partial [Cetraspora pellucida]
RCNFQNNAHTYYFENLRYNNIEMLNFSNIINLEEYINYLKEKYITKMLSDQEIINQIIYLEPKTAEDDEKDNNTELF